MLLAVIVFIGVFIVASLVIAATGVGASERLKQTLSRLEALLVAEGVTQDEQLDVQKGELLSSIPLVNRILLGLEIAPQLRRMLYQANVRWTVGGLLLVSLAAWAVTAYVIYLKTGVLVTAVLGGLVPGAAPFVYVRWKREKRFEKFE